MVLTFSTQGSSKNTRNMLRCKCEGTIMWKQSKPCLAVGSKDPSSHTHTHTHTHTHKSLRRKIPVCVMY